MIRLRGPARRGGRRGEGRRCRLSQSKGAWLVCVVLGRRVVPAAAGSRVHDHVTTVHARSGSGTVRTDRSPNAIYRNMSNLIALRAGRSAL